MKENCFLAFFFSIQNLFNEKAGSGVSFCYHSWPTPLAHWNSWTSEGTSGLGPWDVPRCLYASLPLRTSEQDGATALEGAQGHLGCGHEESALVAAATHCTHLKAGHLLHTHITGYHPCSHSKFALPARELHLVGCRGKGQRGPVGVTHERPLQHHFFFYIVIQLQLYAFSPHPSTPPQPNPPPSPSITWFKVELVPTAKNLYRLTNSLR